MSFHEAAEELRALLDDATRIRLRADVPVAAYLSGGLDSPPSWRWPAGTSSVSCSRSGSRSTTPTSTSAPSRRDAARELGTSFTQVTVDAREIGALLPEAVGFAERPTLRTALVPLLALSGVVRDARDQGRAHRARGPMSSSPDTTSSARTRSGGSGPVTRPRRCGRRSSGGSTATCRARFPSRPSRSGSSASASRRRRTRSTAISARFSNTARVHACSPRTSRQPRGSDVAAELETRLPASFSGFTPLGRAQYLEIATFLTGYLLHAQGDRMLMGHSVEGRFPYPRPPRRRIRGAVSRQPPPARVEGEARPPACGRAVSSPTRSERGPSGRTARRSPPHSPVRRPRSTSPSCSRLRRSERRVCSTSPRWSACATRPIATVRA